MAITNSNLSGSQHPDSHQPELIALPSREISAQQLGILRQLQPGQRIRIIQRVRVGARKWNTETLGTFRSINYLATGVTTERVPEDDIIVPMVHFCKDNNELSSVAIDENSEIALV